MSASKHLEIRALLRQNDDGLTVNEIAKQLKLNSDSTRIALKNMPDTYIDRWHPVANEPLHAVWCAIVPPENCPLPRKQ